MKRLFWHESRIRIRRRTFKALRVMAATIAIMSILFATAFAFVPEFQLRVMNMLLEWTEHSAKFTFSDNDNDSIAVNCPEFIPDGFVESDSMISKASAYIWYENSLTTEEILFTQVPFDSGNSLAIDHEHSDYTTISINGKSGHAFKSIILGEPSYIVFDDGQFAYRLSGEVNIDLLISMAKSIR